MQSPVVSIEPPETHEENIEDYRIPSESKSTKVTSFPKSSHRFSNKASKSKSVINYSKNS